MIWLILFSPQELVASSASSAMMMMVGALATSPADSIQSGISSGANSAYGVMKAVILPIAALALAWCGFKALFGGQKGMEEAKKYALIIIVVVAIVYLAPIIIEQVGGWFANSSKDLTNLTPTTTP